MINDWTIPKLTKIIPLYYSYRFKLNHMYWINNATPNVKNYPNGFKRFVYIIVFSIEYITIKYSNIPKKYAINVPNFISAKLPIEWDIY